MTSIAHNANSQHLSSEFLALCTNCGHDCADSVMPTGPCPKDMRAYREEGLCHDCANPSDYDRTSKFYEY